MSDLRYKFTPDSFPPFPEELESKTVKLTTISLVALQAGDKTEQKRVFKSCKGRGFFFLELGGCDAGETILQGAGEIARIGEKIAELDLDEKMKYAMKDTLFGYKPVGASVTDKQGTKDTAEFFNISKNDMIVSDDKMNRSWPAPVMENKKMLQGYVEAAHGVGILLMDILAEHLGVDPSELRDKHRIEEHSGDHIRITRGPPRKTKDAPEVQTPSHTDFGTITVLMNWLGGLQVWSESARQARAGHGEPEGEGEWLWVKPQKGCAIINMGDAAVKFSNGIFCSGRHRVVPSPVEQGLWPRYSIVYFVRPEDKCILKQLRGPAIPDGPEEKGMQAKDWIIQQARGLGIAVGAAN